MPTKPGSTCNAPCIINSPHAPLYTVFCEKEAGHGGEHSHVVSNHIVEPFTPTRITWNYLGKILKNTVPSFAPECSEWSQNPPLQRFEPDSDQFIQNSKLLFVGIVCTLGFCCEKPRGHDGEHVRSGTYGPLGANWRVEW